MAGEIWVNLPVASVAASRVFFSKLGFRLAERGQDDGLAALLFGDGPFVVNLFPAKTFGGFIEAPVTDTNAGNEVLISLKAETREDVDNLTETARQAGARIVSEPGERDGWMYGSQFADLDGHRWNVLWMDAQRVPVDANMGTLESSV